MIFSLSVCKAEKLLPKTKKAAEVSAALKDQ
jgi:hypothetical protein